MLQFNPFFRKKPEELLAHKIFDHWKRKYPEFLVSPPYRINLEADNKKSFDYATSKFKKYTMSQLK